MLCKWLNKRLKSQILISKVEIMLGNFTGNYKAAINTITCIIKYYTYSIKMCGDNSYFHRSTDKGP